MPPLPRAGPSARRGDTWERLGWWGWAEPPSPQGLPPGRDTREGARGGPEPAGGMGSAHSSFRQTKMVGVEFFFLYIYIRIYIIFPYAFLFTNLHDYDYDFFSLIQSFFFLFVSPFFFFPRARMCSCVSVCGCVGFLLLVCFLLLFFIFLFLFSPGAGTATQEVALRRGGQYKPQPRRLLAMMMSVTASNTTWMLFVSVAHVMWQ